MQGNVVAASILLVLGLALVAAGLIVITRDRSGRRRTDAVTLVFAGYLCGFAALLTAPE